MGHAAASPLANGLSQASGLSGLGADFPWNRRMSDFVDCDREQAFPLPLDLRAWVPSDDLAHFAIDAVERVALAAFKVNHPGTRCGRVNET